MEKHASITQILFLAQIWYPILVIIILTANGHYILVGVKYNTI